MNKEFNDIVLFLSIIATILFEVAVVYIVYLSVPAIHPNSIELTQQFLPYIQNAINPENNERLAYILVVLTLPFSVIFFYKIFSNVSQKNILKLNKPKDIFTLIFAMLIYIGLEVAIILLAIRAETIGIAEMLISSNTFINILFYTFMLLLISVFGTFAVINFKESKYSKIVLITVALFFATAIIAKFLAPNLFGLDEHHVSAYIYPIIRTVQGQTPLVDFQSIYGVYSYFYAIPFKIFGFSEQGFSYLIAVQVMIISASIWLLFATFIKNKLIALLGFISVLSAFIFIPKPIYLQYLPHRVIFPALVISLVVLYLISDKTKTKMILYYVGHIFAAVAVIWNPDSGVIVFVAYLLFHIYSELLNYSFNNKKLYINSLKHIIFSLLSLTIISVMLTSITYLLSEKLINILEIFKGIMVFQSAGFFMLKMNLLHHWELFPLIMIICLGKTLSKIKFLNKDIDDKKKRYSILFFITILAIGLFSYYQGRSHDHVFMLISWLMIPPLTFIVDDLFQKIKEKQFNSKISQINAFLFLSAIITIFLIITMTLTTKIFLSNERFFSAATERVYSRSDYTIDELEKYLSKKEDRNYDIISLKGAIMSTRLNIKYNNFPELIDMFYISEWEMLRDYIDNSSNGIIIEKWYFDLFNSSFDSQLMNIFVKKCLIVLQIGDVLICEKR